MPEETINWTFELWEFNPKRLELETLRTKYEALVIEWIDDKEWYKIVRRAATELVRTRTEIEKTGKRLRDPHTQFNKRVSELEKEYIAIIEPVEKDLKEKLDKIDSEKKWIKEKEDADKRLKFQDRLDKLWAIWYIHPMALVLQEMTDIEFEELLSRETIEHNKKQEINLKIEWYKKEINDCQNLDDLLSLLSISWYEEDIRNEFIKPIYEQRKERLEFENQQAILKQQQEELDKKIKEQKEEDERKAKEQKEQEEMRDRIINRISSILDITKLEEYKIEVDDNSFNTLFEQQKVFIQTKAEQEKIRLQQIEDQRKLDEQKKEQEEQAKAEKTQRYKEFLMSNWYTTETKSDFNITNDWAKYILWKKLWEFSI